MVKFKKSLLLMVSLLAALFLWIPAVQAVSTQGAVDDDICAKFNDPNLEKPAGCNGKVLVDNSGTGYINTLVNAIIFVAGFVAFVFLLIGAIRYLTATGDAARIKQAKDTVLYSIIGLIVVIAARPIADFIISKVRP